MIAGLCLALAIAVTSPADAPTPPDTPPALSSATEPETVSDAELATQRGGFRLGSLDIRLGADIRSYVDGRLVMQTNLSWTDVATSVRHVIAPDSSTAVAGSLAAGLLAGTGMTIGLGDAKLVYADQGQTAFVQRTDGTIQNIVVNTASNVDIRQQIDATLDIQGFAPFRNDLLAGRVGSALAAMGGLALVTRRAD